MGCLSGELGSRDFFPHRRHKLHEPPFLGCQPLQFPAFFLVGDGKFILDRAGILVELVPKVKGFTGAPAPPEEGIQSLRPFDLVVLPGRDGPGHLEFPKGLSDVLFDSGIPRLEVPLRTPQPAFRAVPFPVVELVDGPDKLVHVVVVPEPKEPGPVFQVGPDGGVQGDDEDPVFIHIRSLLPHGVLVLVAVDVVLDKAGRLFLLFHLAHLYRCHLWRGDEVCPLQCDCVKVL